MIDMSRKDFLHGTLGSLIATGVGSGLTLQPAVARPSAPRRTLIRGARVLTMDSSRSEIPRADVLIDGGRIAGISPIIEAGNSEIVEAEGMILMPGLIDGHRHVWHSTFMGRRVVMDPFRSLDNITYANQRLAPVLTPEEVHFANYVGGKMALDAGVTSVVDHCTAVVSPEKGDAAARGLKESGIGGMFCYGLSGSPDYGAGATVSAARADAIMAAPADAWHLEQAAVVRDRHFSSGQDPLQFGVALSLMEFGKRTRQQIYDEVNAARALSPALMTVHLLGGNAPSLAPEPYNLIMDLGRKGLLDERFHVSHGGEFTKEDLKMMRDHGAMLCATPLSEEAFGLGVILARAFDSGVSLGIGVDTPMGVTMDFFEHIRGAFWNLAMNPEFADRRGKLTAYDILPLATIRGAHAIGQGEVIGSIEVGKRADLVLLRTDRMGFGVTGSAADRVLNFAALQDIDSVWVAGRAQKRGGQMLGIDWADVKTKAMAIAEKRNIDAESITFTGKVDQAVNLDK